ncbi:MAG: hypothetical protein WA496_06140, partial [Candidatus Udaeobacter sp.]
MICGAKSRCKCSSGSIEQLEFDIEELFINTPQLSQTGLSASLSGAPEKCAPAELLDRARRNCGGRA